MRRRNELGSALQEISRDSMHGIGHSPLHGIRPLVLAHEGPDVERAPHPRRSGNVCKPPGDQAHQVRDVSQVAYRPGSVVWWVEQRTFRSMQ
ncbi:MAG: hypothetical protein NZM42_08320 [Gemmatales bacterium]|nr:hypothetical protein [Gemmatales bacterium]MDW8223500.1 hypothetical protein [Gemmatales bacterium]